MGRKPTKNLNLPRGMRKRKQRSGKTYYYLDTGETPRIEIPLGPDYTLAVKKWAELTTEVAPTGSLVTFRYVAERYQKEVFPTKGLATQKMNLREFKQLFKVFQDASAPMESIETINVRQYLDWRKSAKIRANREVALFSHVWNFARDAGLTNKANPCTGVKRYKETGRDIYIDDDIYRIVWEASELPLRDALDIAYLTGQRPADVLKLSQADIKDGALHIKQNKSATKLRIALEGDLAAIIKRISSRKVMGLMLVNNESGEAMTASMLRGAFDRARDAAVLENPDREKEIRSFQFRDLRAKAGTDKEESSGMSAAQAQLGHTTPTMTAHYVRHRQGKLVKPTK